MPDWVSWYREITIQHLLDYKAGFSRDDDVGGAMAMFQVSEPELTYRQTHQHFLRTKKMLYGPAPQARIRITASACGRC